MEFGYSEFLSVAASVMVKKNQTVPLICLPMHFSHDGLAIIATRCRSRLYGHWIVVNRQNVSVHKLLEVCLRAIAKPRLAGKRNQYACQTPSVFPTVIVTPNVGIQRRSKRVRCNDRLCIVMKYLIQLSANQRLVEPFYY